jgi:hypothetical protein
VKAGRYTPHGRGAGSEQGGSRAQAVWGAWSAWVSAARGSEGRRFGGTQEWGWQLTACESNELLLGALVHMPQLGSR